MGTNKSQVYFPFAWLGCLLPNYTLGHNERECSVLKMIFFSSTWIRKVQCQLNIWKPIALCYKMMWARTRCRKKNVVKQNNEQKIEWNGWLNIRIFRYYLKRKLAFFVFTNAIDVNSFCIQIGWIFFFRCCCFKWSFACSTHKKECARNDNNDENLTKTVYYRWMKKEEMKLRQLIEWVKNKTRKRESKKYNKLIRVYKNNN